MGRASNLKFNLIQNVIDTLNRIEKWEQEEPPMSFRYFLWNCYGFLVSDSDNVC